MTAFLRWYEGRVRGNSCADWIYAAGHPTLAAEVEEYARRPARFGTLNNAEFVVESIDGHGLTWPALVSRLNAATIHRTQHLLIVRRGDSVPGDVWQELHAWRAAADPIRVRSRNMLVIASERLNTRDHQDPRFLPFVKRHDPKGTKRRLLQQYIDCHVPPDRLPKYAALKLSLGRPTAQLDAVAAEVAHLSGGSLPVLKAECEKLMAYCGDGPVTSEAIAAVVRPSPGSAFVEALTYGRGREAAQRAPYVSSLRATLGLLEWHVHTLYLIHRAIGELPRRRRLAYSKVADRTGVPAFQVMRLESRARQFDLSTTRRRLSAIVRAYLDLHHAEALGADDRPEWILLPLVARW